MFLGVAAIDVSLAAMDVALGINPGRGSQESINRVALVSKARCPVLKIDLCEMESYRRQGTGDEGLCTANCTANQLVQVEEEKCPLVTNYPNDLWKNKETHGLSYPERVCCAIGDTGPSGECSASPEKDKSDGNDDGDNGDDKSAGLIVGSIVGGIALIVCIGICGWCLYPVDADDDDDEAVAAKSPAPTPPIIIDEPMLGAQDVPVPETVVPPPPAVIIEPEPNGDVAKTKAVFPTA